MSAISVTGDKFDVGIKRLSAIVRDTYEPQSVVLVLDKVGIRVTNAVKQILSKPGTGRTYQRGSVQHRASSPGEPPAPDTGQLRASYTWRKGVEGGQAYVEIGTNLQKAPMLEFGTSRMAARPHLRPAVAQEGVNIAREIHAGLTRRLRDEAGKRGAS